MKKAIITGVTGQDGSYLSELLLSEGYEVHGIMRRSSTFSTQRIDHLYSNPNFFTHYGDLTDATSLRSIIESVKPDEFYNLGAMSHVKISFEIPKYTLETNAIGVLNVLDILRLVSPHTKFYQASSSEMFGVPGVPTPFNEETPMHPQSPYGAAKLCAFNLTEQYRNGYGMFATTGILFNHESPRRGENFVTKKITQAVARIKLGLQIEKLKLGNLDAKRDWGWSPDFVRAIYMIMQQDKPGVFVVATEETHTVREFVKEAFEYVYLNWEDHVEIDDKYKRPNEVPILLGDATKIHKLGWQPTMKFTDICHAMVDYDLKAYGAK